MRWFYNDYKRAFISNYINVRLPAINVRLNFACHTSDGRIAWQQPGYALMSLIQTVKKVKDEASELQDQFVKVVYHTRMNFSRKPVEFLSDLRIFLTELPLSNKFTHLHFLKEKEQAIVNAQSIDEIFKILCHHWNYGDYALLQRMIQECGSKALQKEMREYVEALEMFEKKTTIQDFSLAKPGARGAPDGFSKVVLELNIDPSKYILYDARQLAESLEMKLHLNQYAFFLNEIFCSSVIIKLAFPRAVLELIVPALDKEFLEIHQIVSVTIDKKPLEEYTEAYVKVCVYMVSQYVHFKKTLSSCNLSMSPYM